MSAPVPKRRRGPFARPARDRAPLYCAGLSSPPKGGGICDLMTLGLIAVPFLLGIIMPKDQDRDKEQLDRAAALGHEPRDLPARGILAFGIAFVIVMGLVLVVVTATNLLLLGHLPSAPFPPANLQNAPIPTLPPEPRLEAEPGQQLQQLRSEEDKLLHSYGWVDQKAGVVHVPIDRAMDILAQRGLPVRPTPQTKFEDNGQQSPSYPSSGRVMEPYP